MTTESIPTGVRGRAKARGQGGNTALPHPSTSQVYIIPTHLLPAQLRTLRSGASQGFLFSLGYAWATQTQGVGAGRGIAAGQRTAPQAKQGD